MYVCLSILIGFYRAFRLKHTYIHVHVTTFWPPIFPCMFQFHRYLPSNLRKGIKKTRFWVSGESLFGSQNPAEKCLSLYTNYNKLQIVKGKNSIFKGSVDDIFFIEIWMPWGGGNFMYVCMYVCLDGWMYVCMDGWITSIHTNIHTYMSIGFDLKK